MECCCCFDIFRRRKISCGKEAAATDTKAFPHTVIKISKERFLAYKLGSSNDNSVSKNTRHHKSVVPIGLYRSSYVTEDAFDSGDERSTHGLIHSGFNRSSSSRCISDINRKERAGICRSSVKVTVRAVRSQDPNGNKMVNQYVKEGLIGTGSYGKVILYRSKLDHKFYAIKIIQRSRLRRIRVAPSETALTDVMREIEIMKQLEHPRIVNLVEVIDDPDSDRLYIVLEYVEGGNVFGGCGPPGGIGEHNSRRYFRDIVEGLMYLHWNNVIHGDVKPENLLVSIEGHIKIADFSVSHIFEGDDDKILRSPGTPVFTAPECCSGLPYHGKTADVWALGVTLFCMLYGCYPFVANTLQDMYDKIVNEPLHIPLGTDADLANLLEGLLSKDPQTRLTLDDAARHPWVLKGICSLSKDTL